MGGPLGPPLGAAPPLPLAEARGGASAIADAVVGKDRLPEVSATAIGAEGCDGMPPGALFIVG